MELGDKASSTTQVHTNTEALNPWFQGPDDDQRTMVSRPVVTKKPIRMGNWHNHGFCARLKPCYPDLMPPQRSLESSNSIDQANNLFDLSQQPMLYESVVANIP